MVVEKDSGRVSGRAPRSSRSCFDDGGGLQYVSIKMICPLDFSRRGEYIGERAASGGGPGGLTTWWRGQGLGRATPWCGWPLPPLRLIFSKNRRFGFCFVQFREYFLCSFSETQKQQKTRNWHCGISLVVSSEKCIKTPQSVTKHKANGV
jgi:hypothetical protein